MAQSLETVGADELQTIGILEGLSPADLQEIGRQATRVRLSRRQTIHSPESCDEAAYLLLGGKVKLFHMSDEGREIIVDILQAGDVFGELQSSEDSESMWAETLDTCEIAVLPRESLKELLRQRPEVALRLLGEMGERLRRRASQIEDLALRSVPSRVANTLLRLGESHGTMGRGGITIALRLTHQDIANMVAAARETVTNVLVHLREDGIINIERKHVRIADLDRLQGIAALN